MRIAVATSILVLALAACGGSPRPAATEADTSSLESGGGAASAGTSEGSPSTSTAAAPAAAGPAAAATADATSAAAPAPTHPVPGATGAIDGQPFSPKLAQITGPVQKDGRALIVIHEGGDCTAAATASISLLVPYKDGFKTDLASLRRAKGGSLNEAAFVRRADGKKQQVSSTFKPTGLVTIVSAPTDKGAIGKMKIDLQSGDYMLAGDLDVKVCAGSK